MNNSMKIFLGLLISIFLISCKDEGIKNSRKNIDLTENKSEADFFILAYDSINRANNVESKMFDLLSKHFFNNKQTEIKYYALFCYYCLHHKDESFSETASQYTFKLFTESKVKGDNLVNFVNQLPEKERDHVLTAIANLMCLDLGINEYDVKRFNKDFKSLAANKEVQKAVKKCFDEEVW